MPSLPRIEDDLRGKFIAIICPSCGLRNKVAEESEGVMWQELDGFYNGWEEWGDRDFDDTRVIKIYCFHCGFCFWAQTMGVEYPTDLFHYFRTNGWLDIEERDEGRTKWEV